MSIVVSLCSLCLFVSLYYAGFFVLLRGHGLGVGFTFKYITGFSLSFIIKIPLSYSIFSYMC